MGPPFRPWTTTLFMKAKSIDRIQCESDGSSSWCGFCWSPVSHGFWHNKKLQMWNTSFAGIQILHKLTQLGADIQLVENSDRTRDLMVAAWIYTNNGVWNEYLDALSCLFTNWNTKVVFTTFSLWGCGRFYKIASNPDNLQFIFPAQADLAETQYVLANYFMKNPLGGLGDLW